MDVLSQRLEQETGLLLQLSVGSQDQEYVEPDLFIEDWCQVLLLPDYHLTQYLNSLIIGILVIKLTKPSHLLFHFLFLQYNPKHTSFEI